MKKLLIENKKMVAIAAGVLALVLLGCLALNVMSANAPGNNTPGTETETTETPNSLNVSMAKRYIFTNDIATLADLSSFIKNTNDKAYELHLIRFEKKDPIGRVDDLALKNLTRDMGELKEEKALAFGSEEIPTQPGIYRSVLEIKDENENAVYEEVIVILDTTPARIEDASDVTVSVGKDKLSEKPEIDTSIYKAYDEVDGNLKGEELSYDLTLMDETKHEWKLTITCTDRAGNKSEVHYKVTVVEGKDEVASGDSGNGGTTTTPSQPSAPSQPSTPSTPSTPSQPTTPSTPLQPTTPSYDPADKNNDGFVSVEEQMMHITPAKQKCIDAGYGVVVELDGGTWYAVLVEDPYYTYNGMTGSNLLREYLKERNLHAEHVGGCWINPDNGWYWYTAEGITKIPESSDDDFNFEDGEIEWH